MKILLNYLVIVLMEISMYLLMNLHPMDHFTIFFMVWHSISEFFCSIVILAGFLLLLFLPFGLPCDTIVELL